MNTLSPPAVDLFGQVVATGQKVKRARGVDDHERSRDYLLSKVTSCCKLKPPPTRLERIGSKRTTMLR